MFSFDRAVAIIIKDDKLLVLRRNNHGAQYYVLPGGGVEKGESPEQAVIRELKEETMFDVEIKQKLYEHHLDNGHNHYFFLCTTNGTDPRFAPDSPEAITNDPDDVREPMWLDLKLLPETLLYPLEIRDWLIDDLKNGFSPKTRIAELKLSERRQSL